VSDFAKRKLDFHPDALQAAVLDSQSKRGVLNCIRQRGKSTVLAIKAVHRACTVARSLILLASPCSRQSREFLRKAAEFLSRLGIKRRGDGDNSCPLSLPNGSRIVGIPGTEATIRGFSAVSLLLIDEASRASGWELTRCSAHVSRRQRGPLAKLASSPFGKRPFYEAGPLILWFRSEFHTGIASQNVYVSCYRYLH
jgi:hypothetical protein